MTVSTSTAGTSYSSGGTNISSSYSSSYYQLKYNQQINFSCDNTTRMAVYSSARNDTSPFYKDLSTSNYSSSSFFRYDYQDNSTSLAYTNFELICVNLNAGNNLLAVNEKKGLFIRIYMLLLGINT